MRVAALGATFLTQLHALVHAEAMLLVHDRDREPVEVHSFLEQGMCAHGHVHAAVRQVLQQRRAGAPGEPPGEQADAHAERIEPAREVPRVLLRQQLRGRHHRGLRALLDGAQRRERRHHGFAGAHVALHQPHHRMRALEVGGDLVPDAALCRGQRERQLCETAIHQVGLPRQRPRLVAVGRLAQQPQADLVREQLLEGEPPLRGVPSVVPRRDVLVRRRPVHAAQRRLERRQADDAERLGRHPVAQPAALQLRERESGQCPHAPLLHALGGRIYRRQAF